MSNSGIMGWPRIVQPSSKGLTYFQHRGLAADRFTVAGAITTKEPLAQTVSLNVLYAAPLVSQKGGVIDRLSFKVSVVGAAGSKGRMGIYTNIANDIVYPDMLLVDGGDIATDVGATVKSLVMQLRLMPGRLYWLIALFGTAAPNMSCYQPNGPLSFLGIDGGFGFHHGIGWQVGYTFGALPSRYPMGGTVTSTAENSPMMMVRYASSSP